MQSALRELKALIRANDSEGLRAALAEHASPLGGELESLDETELYRRVRRLIQVSNARETARRDAALRAESRQAQHELARTAVFAEGGIWLDPRLLLGPLLAERSKYVCVHVDNWNVAVERSRLLRARRALRPFRDLTASIDPSALRFGWHGGRGGLVLRPQVVSRVDRSSIVNVVLTRPFASPEPTRPHRRNPPSAPRRTPSKWLTELGDALGFTDYAARLNNTACDQCVMGSSSSPRATVSAAPLLSPEVSHACIITDRLCRSITVLAAYRTPRHGVIVVRHRH